LPPGKIRLPTDAYVEPTDLDFFFRGRLEHNGPKPSTVDDAAK
jgi:hypothetical protein